MNKKCKACGEEFVSTGKPTSLGLLRIHYKSFPDHNPQFNKKNTNKPLFRSSTELINQGEQLIRDALKQLDFERDELHRKLRDLDDIAAKYKKVLNPNQTGH